jgi:hypothetical protein
MTNLNNATTAAAKAQAPSEPGRPAAHAPTARIAVQTEANPKKAGTASHERFALYHTTDTVAEYIAAVVASGATRAKARADLRWDQARGYITIG